LDYDPLVLFLAGGLKMGRSAEFKVYATMDGGVMTVRRESRRYPNPIISTRREEVFYCPSLGISS
jgi:hypothetical protein